MMVITMMMFMACSDKSKEYFESGKIAYDSGQYVEARVFFMQIDSLSQWSKQAREYVRKLDSLASQNNSSKSSSLTDNLVIYLAEPGTEHDTSQIQVINETCAIIMEEYGQQTVRRLEREKEEQAQRLIEEERARAEWESQPHDSTEVFPGYFPGYEGDGDYYFSEAMAAFTELKINVITAAPKNYVRLMGSNRKQYTLDIRSNMEPQWTIILFRVDKSPVVVDAMDVQNHLKQYYFGQ